MSLNEKHTNKIRKITQSYFNHLLSEMYKLMPEEKQLFIDICKSEFFLLEGTYRPGSNPLENYLRVLCQLKRGAGCNGPEKILEKLEVTGKILSKIHDVIEISPDKCRRIKAIIEDSKSSLELHRNPVWDTVYNIISVLIPPIGIIRACGSYKGQFWKSRGANVCEQLEDVSRALYN